MYQICVSGAAKGATVEEDKDLAGSIGAAIAKAGHSLLTGATVGLPNYAAMAYKKAGGTMSVGISPASSKAEHILKYRLPTEAYDTILYTGLHYIGRDTLLVLSSDAVVSIGGRLGTLHEFTIAMESHKPIGMLEGSGGVGAEIHNILEAAGESRRSTLIFGNDPDKLVKEIIEVLDVEDMKYKALYV